jgi:polysaccharide export outer membrane protein
MGIDYLINPDGNVQLPILGKVNLTGLTIEQAQDTLAQMYAIEYNKPFVQLEVTNRRAVVFTGGGGRANVVPITNNNTTLMEALALAGGVDTRGRVKKIKIMRRTSEGRVIYEVDMSTLAGLKYADMIVQANDYIYVQPVPYIGRELLAEVSAITSLLTSSIFLYSLISND